MGFASYLEDITDRYVDSGHSSLQGSRTTGVRVDGWAAHIGSKPKQRDIAEANDVYGDPWERPCRLIQDFWSYYRQQEPLTGLTGDWWQSHFQTVTEIHKVLSPIKRIHSLRPDPWSGVRTMRTQLRKLIDTTGDYGPLSQSTLKIVEDVSKDIFKRCQFVRDELKRFDTQVEKLAIKPIKGSRKSDIRKSIEQMGEISERLRSDLDEIEQYKNVLNESTELWDAFLTQFTTLAVERGYRPALQDLDRLCLNKLQEKFVTLNHDGSYRIQGASGSGKTIILIHRALRLARENPESKVRVFTINRALAELLKSTIKAINGVVPPNLSVSAFYDFLIEAVHLFERGNKYRLVDNRSRERIPVSWLDFYQHKGRQAKQNVFADKFVMDLVRSIMIRENRTIDACRYLRDEVLYIQSAYRKSERQKYLSDPRRSRSIPMQGSHRNSCIRVLHAWEEWLAVGQLCDIDGLTLRAADYFDRPADLARIQKSLRTDFVLVDEVQDFSTIELAMLRKLVSDPETRNRLFLVGDLNQKVYSKHQDTRAAGYDFRGRAGVLRQSFRNTRQILKAAYNLPQSFPPKEDCDEALQLQDPEWSVYDGGRPVALECKAKSHVKTMLSVVKKRIQNKVAVVSENEQLLQKIRLAAHKEGIKTFDLVGNEDLDKWRDQGDVLASHLVLSRLEAVKGFEFDTVIACDLSQGVFPRPGTPEDEHWRQAAVLYAALTRARDELVITYVDEPSRFLKAMLADVDHHEVPDDARLRKVLSIN